MYFDSSQYSKYSAANAAVGENGINIPPISVESENSNDLVCVRLFLRSAASEPDTDWNCELYSGRSTRRK